MQFHLESVDRAELFRILYKFPRNVVSALDLYSPEQNEFRLSFACSCFSSYQLRLPKAGLHQLRYLYTW